MVPKELPKLHPAHIENKAEKFLRETLGADFDVPIDVDFLLESAADVDLDYAFCLERDHGIHGVVFHDMANDRICVHIDADLADSRSRRNRYRMTVAEELGHAILHRDVILGIESVEDFRKLQQHSDWQSAERNAKQFGAAVLMPGRLVTSEAEVLYASLVSVAGFGDIEVIKKFLRNKLADKFEVSPESMGIRLRERPMRVYDRVDESMNARLHYLV